MPVAKRPYARATEFERVVQFLRDHHLPQNTDRSLLGYLGNAQ
jgi:hypothetical protein